MPGEAPEPGEFLADARALEAAGADTLWLEAGVHDAWMLAAAIATVTSRVGIGLTVDDRATGLVPRIRTLQRFSRGRARLQVEARGLERLVQLARKAGGCRVLGRADDAGAWSGVTALADGLLLSGANPEEDGARLERIRALTAETARSGVFEAWVELRVPEAREAWRRAVALYQGAGATGLVFPFDSRLVDLLRRADEEDDRSDLALAQG